MDLALPLPQQPLRPWDECGLDDTAALLPSTASELASGEKKELRGRALQDCGSLLPGEKIAEFDQKISQEPAVIFKIANSRCSYAAEKRFRAQRLCFTAVELSDAEWSYFKCKHPDEIVNGAQMHSYVYVGGQFLGNGFKLLNPATHQAPFTLYSDSSLKKMASAAKVATCEDSCASLLPEKEREELHRVVDTTPVVLYGWNGCPCTSIARTRFMNKGLCFLENVWGSPQDPRMQYLNCLYGEEHHSFVWIGGKFVGNGFDFDEAKMADAKLMPMLEGSQATFACQKEGDANLWGGELKSCTQSNDGTTTGWTRSGSCVWEPSDSGYHQVCVTMSQEFLKSSAKYDANDLSSVVKEGGHWCICAWAWASAVSRDPKSYEGIELDCERTNGRLRDVYELYMGNGEDIHSPSGAGYKPAKALEAVNKVCGGEGEPDYGARRTPVGGDTEPSGDGASASSAFVTAAPAAAAALLGGIGALLAVAL